MRSLLVVGVTVVSTFVVLVPACGGDDASTAKLPDGCGCDTATNSDGSGNPDGSANPDTSPTDSATNLDSSDGASNGDGLSGLPCGSSTCNLSTTSCCVDINVDASGVFSCAATCPMGTIALKCRSAVDCPGSQVCCTDSSGDPILSACMSSCASGEAMLCDPSASDTKNRCGDAGACSNANIDSWNLPDTFGTCGGLMN